jgi:hypothetical protein
VVVVSVVMTGMIADLVITKIIIITIIVVVVVVIIISVWLTWIPALGRPCGAPRGR